MRLVFSLFPFLLFLVYGFSEESLIRQNILALSLFLFSFAIFLVYFFLFFQNRRIKKKDLPHHVLNFKPQSEEGFGRLALLSMTFFFLFSARYTTTAKPYLLVWVTYAVVFLLVKR